MVLILKHTHIKKSREHHSGAAYLCVRLRLCPRSTRISSIYCKFVFYFSLRLTTFTKSVRFTDILAICSTSLSFQYQNCECISISLDRLNEWKKYYPFSLQLFDVSFLYLFFRFLECPIKFVCYGYCNESSFGYVYAVFFGLKIVFSKRFDEISHSKNAFHFGCLISWIREKKMKQFKRY